MKKSLLIIATSIISSLSLVGCNTMHGLGQDIQDGGKAISRAAAPKQKTSTTVTYTKTKQ